MTRYLTDTNVLIALSLEREDTIRFMEQRRQLGALFFTTLQIVCEFWNVCTRPKDNNGLGLSPEFTVRALDRLRIGFPTLPDTDFVRRELLQLLRDHKVRGKQIYDARLAASVLAHQLDGILTYNDQDFVRFPGVHPISPKTQAND